MSDDFIKEANYEAMLRRQEQAWKNANDFVLSSDKVAADIGIEALKVATLINAAV